MRRKNDRALAGRLKRAFEQTHDKRFLAAINALSEHFPEASKRKPGPAKQWDEFNLMVLWILVEAHRRAFNYSISAACHSLATKGRFAGPTGRLGAKGRLESRYQEADKSLKADPDSFREADCDADAWATKLRVTSRIGTARTLK
jgi:hypothetical protein